MKEQYAEFCNENYVPIFSKPWWMDAVSVGSNWDVYMVQQGDSLVAAMPYYFEKRMHGTCITKAKNTQNNGIIFSYPAGISYPAKLSFEEKIINQVCDYIESLDLTLYEQQFHYTFTNWLPFFWRGYHEMTRYTYIIENTENYDSVYSQYTSRARNSIRKAEKLLTIDETIPSELFFRVNQLSFLRQGLQTEYTFEYFDTLYRACKVHNSGKLLAARDDQGNIHSVAFLVWDERSVYYLLNGTDPTYKSSQANSMLIDAGIKLAGKMSLSFDFEGSVIKPIEHAFRAFGCVQKPYFRIYKNFCL